MHSIVTTFRGAVIKVEVANFCAAMDTLIDQDETSLAKAVHYPHIAWIPDLESRHSDPDHSKNLINCSLYHCRAILKISSNAIYNLLSNWPDF